MTVMGSDTEYLPDEITYGFVADRVLLAIGDTAGDDDRFPDGVPAQGTVKFSPERTILYTQETPATVLPQDIECTIYHSAHPVAVNNGYEPELVGKLVDPAGHVGNVALIVGWYEAVYRLETGTAQRFRFKVLPEHTNENPLWLPSVAPLTPTPSERFVVNEQVYNDTKEARDEAVGAAVTAVTARTGAETARDTAGTHATNSAASASTAADILAANQALQPSFVVYTPSLEDGVAENNLLVTALEFGTLKIVSIIGGFQHTEDRRYLFTVRAEHRPRSTITFSTQATGTQFTQQMTSDGMFRNWSERTQPMWAYLNIMYITNRT